MASVGPAYPPPVIHIKTQSIKSISTQTINGANSRGRAGSMRSGRYSGRQVSPSRARSTTVRERRKLGPGETESWSWGQGMALAGARRSPAGRDEQAGHALISIVSARFG